MIKAINNNCTAGSLYHPEQGARDVMDILLEIEDAERARCAAIVQLAREGEIDRDFRSIIHRIESGNEAVADDRQ